MITPLRFYNVWGSGVVSRRDASTLLRRLGIWGSQPLRRYVVTLLRCLVARLRRDAFTPFGLGSPFYFFQRLEKAK